MADKDIYHASSGNKLNWGRRIYYFNCHRDTGDFEWFKDNLSSAAQAPVANDLTVDWLFRKHWNPVEEAPRKKLSENKLSKK